MGKKVNEWCVCSVEVFRGGLEIGRGWKVKELDLAGWGFRCLFVYWESCCHLSSFVVAGLGRNVVIYFSLIASLHLIHIPSSMVSILSLLTPQVSMSITSFQSDILPDLLGSLYAVSWETYETLSIHANPQLQLASPNTTEKLPACFEPPPTSNPVNYWSSPAPY